MARKIDEKKLAKAYNRALALEKEGRLAEAAEAYREVLALDPEDHGGAEVRLAATGFGDTPLKAPGAYVETLFDQHADDFEDILVEQLGYCVPMTIRQRFQAPRELVLQPEKFYGQRVDGPDPDFEPDIELADGRVAAVQQREAFEKFVRHVRGDGDDPIQGR